MPLPLIIGAVGAGLGLAGVSGAAASSLGRNNNQHQNFGDSKFYDANRYEYGGQKGLADQTAARYQGRQNEYNATMGAATRDAGAMYGLAAQDRGNALQARGMQQQAADLMRARAMGQVPSIAQMQGDRAMEQAVAGQASQMASARGPAALALAQQNAAGNMAGAQSQIAGQTQIAAAQERLAAEQAYGGMAGQMRGQDYQGQQNMFGAANQQSQFALGLGGLGAQYAGLENQVRQQQTNANLKQQEILSNSQQQGQQIESIQDQNNANRDLGMLKMALGAGEGATGSVQKLAGAKAAGGPVDAGKPYLVGELGPEIVVPSADATVIPSNVSMGLLGRAPVGAGAMGPAEASAYKLGTDGSGNPGIDVMGTMKANNETLLRSIRNPVGGPVQRGLFG